MVPLSFLLTQPLDTLAFPWSSNPQLLLDPDRHSCRVHVLEHPLLSVSLNESPFGPVTSSEKPSLTLASPPNTKTKPWAFH